jgi:hypothetical protein
MATKKVLAWHFTDGMKLRDGTPLVVGKLYKHTGPLEMCAKGYHASEDILDALRYAQGWIISRVECSGKIIKGDDKMVCEQRKAIKSVDVKKIILAWSMRVATDAVKMWRKKSTDEAWNKWATLWISGEDRTYAANAAAANAAAYAANAAANAAYAAAAANAAYAYAAAAYAAYAAANAAAAYAAAKKKAYDKYRRWLITDIEKAIG